MMARARRWLAFGLILYSWLLIRMDEPGPIVLETVEHPAP